jgi:hypothetical protein
MDMRKSIALITAAVLTVGNFAYLGSIPARAQEAVVAEAGRPLFSADGKRIGTIYRLTAQGAPQIIIEGRMVTVPANTVSVADGKIVTSLTKREALARR